MPNDWIRVHSEVDKAFENGTVFDASPEQLSRWLGNLCTGSIPNPDIQHREIVRGITINHIQMTRLIADLNRRNTWLTVAIGLITFFSLAASVIQAVAAWHILHAPITQDPKSVSIRSDQSSYAQSKSERH
jgi:hypothetical protein